MSIAATSRSGVALKRRGSLRDEDNVLITEERHEVITADVPLLD
jgi:Xaa-Pro aminopeptidase